MESRLLKCVLLCVCVGLLTVPLFGQRGRGGSGGGGGGSTACAIVAAPTLSTTTASAGDSVGVFSRVTNCATGKGRYTITISAVSSCGEETIAASSVISFNGGESKLVSTPYIVAPGTCTGGSTVFVNVYSGTTMLASASAPLTIQ
jgi:hypothetical protein